MIAKSKREHLAGWLWAMYERSYQEEMRLRSVGLAKEARHFGEQMRKISNILASITHSEYPLTR